MRDFILLYINGKRHQISGETIFQPLSDWLRYKQGLVGTKVVCAEGDCGACSALLGRVRNGTLKYEVFNTCIQYVYQLDCQHVVTVEGLKENGQLHPVQQAMIDHFGSQCGYCTPGFVVTMAGLFESQEALTEQNVREGLTGNLCRCTGYQSIIKAALAVNPDTVKRMGERFPAALMVEDFKEHRQTAVAIEYEETLSGESITKRHFNPVTLQEAIRLKSEHPGATLVAGGTDISVQMNKHRIDPQTVISLSNVLHLDTLAIEADYLKIGAKVSLRDLEDFCKAPLFEFYKILQVFASDQIKNVGTLAGNIVNASPIADALPLLFVTNAEIELRGGQSARWVNINEFYHGYKKIEIQADELITQIRLPLPKQGNLLKLYKVSKRRDLDISIFTAGIFMEMAGKAVRQVRIAYGGVAPVVLRLTETENFLKNKTLDLENIKKAGKLARREIVPISDVRASHDYRFQLAENTLLKFYYEVLETLSMHKERTP